MSDDNSKVGSGNNGDGNLPQEPNTDESSSQSGSAQSGNPINASANKKPSVNAQQQASKAFAQTRGTSGATEHKKTIGVIR